MNATTHSSSLSEVIQVHVYLHSNGSGEKVADSSNFIYVFPSGFNSSKNLVPSVLPILNYPPSLL